MLRFFSKSKSAKPGCGVGESLGEEDIVAALQPFPDFRKRLSNFDLCEFEHEGRRYASIEHGFHAAKVRLAGLEAREKDFEVGGKWKLPNAAKSATGRRQLKMTADMLETWAGLRNQVLYDLSLAQYTQHPEKMQMLKATGSGTKLYHIMPRSGGRDEHFVWLERIRDGGED